MLRLITLAASAALSHSFAVPPLRTPSARAAKPTTVTHAAPLVLPTVPELALAAGVPTALGLWRTGFAVSYGYGGAIAASAYLYLQKTSGVAKLHATALAFYGIRLCAYLLLRGATTEMRPIKAKAASVADRLKRLPLLAGCASLYAFLAAPLRVTAAGRATDAVELLVKASFVSFGVAAVADAWKYVAKQLNGKDHLVTGGPFFLFRHPNYTFEVLGWLLSFAAAVSAAAPVSKHVPALACSALGAFGIYGVLAGEAASGLEKKQREKYGDSPEYEKWVARTWAGPMLGAPKVMPPRRVTDAFERVAWSGPAFPKK